MDKNLQLLIKELLLCSQEYYQEGVDSLLTDEEYDDKIEYLRGRADADSSIAENSDVISLLEGSVAGGSSPSEDDEVVRHTVPMLSLLKANTADEMKSFYNKSVKAGAKGHVVQAKLDGFAIEARYVGDKLNLIATRGDGEVGQDISYLIDHKELTILGLPSKLSTMKDIVVRGEVFMRDSQFDEVNKTRAADGREVFKNSRNGVVGILKQAKGGLGYHAEITFAVYNFMQDGKYMDSQLLSKAEPSMITIDDLTEEELKLVGSDPCTTALLNFSDLMKIVDKFGIARQTFDIPTDGVVIKPTNEAEMFDKMGSTSHHPVAFIAFKYPGEKTQSTVLDIVLSVGKTGKITPVAKIIPVVVDSTEISNVHLHNFAWIAEKGLKIGSKVMVTRANDVIPKISTVIEAGDGPDVELPTSCPSCGGPLVGDGNLIPRTLSCMNEKCPERIYFQMRDATSKRGFDIDGLNNVGLLALCQTGKIEDPSDLFGLVEADLEDLVMGETKAGGDRKFGKARAKKVIGHISKAKIDTPAFKIVNLLGFHGLGTSISKQLLEEFGSIEGILNANRKQLEKMERFGDTRVEVVLSRQASAKVIYDKMVTHGVVVDNGLNEVKVESNGKSFAISGKVPADFANRDGFVDYMTGLGWAFDKAPKKTTTVVFGDKDDTSSKITKAHKLGLTIVNPEDYKTV